MICPLCQHLQERGTECEVCGRAIAPEPLDAGGTTKAGTATLDGLETTALDSGAAPAVVEVASWLERTMHGAVSLATVEPIEVERASGGPRQPVPTTGISGALLCRYCRSQVAPSDVFCGRCGMKLAIYRSSAADDPEPRSGTRCRVCGTVTSGPACPGCGARVPPEDG